METFINRWLWLMSLKDIKKLKESIEKQSQLKTSSNASASTNLLQTSQKLHQSTSPSELPPPSPASSIGSSAGSVNGNSSSNNTITTTTTTTSTVTTTSTNNVTNTTNASNEASVQQQNSLDLIQKSLNLYEIYAKFNDYILKSQNFWDQNEQLINENDYLNGK
jgi:hypothetical protein